MTYKYATNHVTTIIREVSTTANLNLRPVARVRRVLLLIWWQTAHVFIMTCINNNLYYYSGQPTSVLQYKNRLINSMAH